MPESGGLDCGRSDRSARIPNQATVPGARRIRRIVRRCHRRRFASAGQATIPRARRVRRIVGAGQATIPRARRIGRIVGAGQTSIPRTRRIRRVVRPATIPRTRRIRGVVHNALQIGRRDLGGGSIGGIQPQGQHKRQNDGGEYQFVRKKIPNHHLLLGTVSTHN